MKNLSRGLDLSFLSDTVSGVPGAWPRQTETDMKINKPRIRVERIGDGEYAVREYSGRNIKPAELFRGDIAEAQDYAQEYVEDIRMMASRQED